MGCFLLMLEVARRECCTSLNRTTRPFTTPTPNPIEVDSYAGCRECCTESESHRCPVVCGRPYNIHNLISDNVQVVFVHPKSKGLRPLSTGCATSPSLLSCSYDLAELDYQLIRKIKNTELLSSPTNHFTVFFFSK